MKKIIILLAVVIWTMNSCVPPTKFKSLQDQSITLRQENENLKAENERLGVEIREARARLQTLEKKMLQTGSDTIRWQQDLSSMEAQLSRLQRDYSDLQEANSALIKGSESEIKRMLEDLQNAQNEMQRREDELTKLSRDLTTRQAEAERMQQEIDSRNERLAELEKTLYEQENRMNTLRRTISDALLGFENQGLTVTQKDGKVYVSLDEQLLFRSGSTQADPKGVTALRNLARVLEQNPDIYITIEGHTDDVPVVSGSIYKDNWDLSVLRATSIARILLEGSKIDPIRITTSGRGQYLPVDPAKTAEARQKNRRTEIILAPRLDVLYEIISD